MISPISVTFKVAILSVLFVTIYFSINSYVNLQKDNMMFGKIKEIAEYSSHKIDLAIHAAWNGINYSETFYLPYLDRIYALEANCSGISILEYIRKYFEPKLFNCTYVNISGKIFPGRNCIESYKINETFINVKVYAC
ncbi:MAG: hypothetical protein QW735_00960 [archaeon]